MEYWPSSLLKISELSAIVTREAAPLPSRRRHCKPICNDEKQIAKVDVSRCVLCGRMEVLFFAFCLKFFTLLAVISTTRSTPLCTQGCRCRYTGGLTATSLTVDCRRNVNVNRELLTEQINSLLSSNLTYGRLTSLRIINTPLTNVPRSVCRLTTLTHLNLDSNRLTRLPDNCLSNLTRLTSFSASANYITELQDGLFDGLRKLQRLTLNRNRISSIGLRVFHCPVRLTSLTEVDLSKNAIQTLEPWPLYLGHNGEVHRKATTALSHNNISTFSNLMGCNFHCGMKAMYFDLRLDHNSFRHVSDILHGWNISITETLCLHAVQGGRMSSYVTFYHTDMECDCVDFDVYKMVLSPLFRSKLLTNVYCDNPEALYNRKLSTVHLDQFVCELTERCPTGCRCVHRPAYATLHVYCSNTNLTVLPLELPKLPKSYTKYKLDFSNNRGLRRLEHRDYFVNTSILDVSNCNLHSVDFDIWNELANIPQVFLDGNQLQSLPSSVTAVSLEKTHIIIGRNPWTCSCNASWMSTWLKSVKRSLTLPIAITCYIPSKFRNRSIMSISNKAFCADPTSEAGQKALTVSILSTATTIGVVIVLLSICVVVYRLRVKLYTSWKFHPFDRDECLGEHMVYDVFLSCSSNDNLPHGNGIRQQLEQRGYRVCYPPRDFVAGEAISDNIYNAVVRSKRTVCLLTAQFLLRFVPIH